MQHRVPSSGYLHSVPGRLRVKLTPVKKAPAVARQVEQALERRAGVIEAIANPLTGSVLVRYDPQQTAPAVILKALAPYGYRDTPAPLPMESSFSSQLGWTLGKELAKIALGELLPDGPLSLLFALI